MIEYRVWCENGDLVLVTTDKAQAEEELEDLEANCPCDDGYCGVLSPHGYSIQEVVDD